MMERAGDGVRSITMLGVQMTFKGHAFCMSATPFTSDDRLDEPAFRLHLRRMVEAGVGVFVGSPGSGEGNALSDAELKRVYEIGAEECRGKVPVFANPPEVRSARHMLERVRMASAAGVDLVQIYSLDAGHGVKPTYDELERYYREILDQVDYPLALSVHAGVGYVVPIKLMKTLLNDYRQLVAATIMVEPGYMLELMDSVGHRIAYYNSNRTLLDGLALGARGALMGHANFVPRLSQSLFDCFARGELDRVSAIYTDLLRVFDLVPRWGTNPRWIKMAMKIFDQPGHSDCRLRLPFITPAATELADMEAAFQAIDLRRKEGLD
jgi:4-hydroxy-tetrahydrodipicolinate synthase